MTFIVPSNHHTLRSYILFHITFPLNSLLHLPTFPPGAINKNNGNSYSLIAKGTQQPFEVRAISHFTEVKTEAQKTENG